MRPLTLFIASSLDHYIARPDGAIDWLHYPEFEVPDEDYGYHAFIESIDTTLMGRVTYDVLMGFDVPFPYPDKTNYVFTRSTGHTDTEQVQFISRDVVPFVRGLKQQSGKGIWLIGGGKLNAALMLAGLVDQIILTILPVVLGEGIPLFTPHAKETRFDLQKSHTYDSGMVQLILQRRG